MNLLIVIAVLSSPIEPEWIGKAPHDKINRIVSLAPNLTELVFALNQGHKIVGVTQFDNYPPEVGKLPKVGGFINPSLEAIVATKPDIVLATPNSGGKTIPLSLARLGIPVYSVPAQKWNHLYPAITALAALLECPSEGKKLIGNLRHQELALKKQFGGALAPKPTLVALGLNPIFSAGPESFIDKFLPLIGLSNVVTQGGPYPILDAEAVFSLKPSIVLDLSMGPKNVSQTFWNNFPQSDEFEIRFSHDQALLRLGPRIFIALGRLGDAIHHETPL